MKRILIFIIITCFTSCGVGSYSVSSGVTDEGAISFVSKKSLPITVIIDGIEHNVLSVKNKAYKTGRNIKQTANNTIKLSTGKHDVRVMSGNEIIYSKKIFISTTEHKIIEL